MKRISIALRLRGFLVLAIGSTQFVFDGWFGQRVLPLLRVVVAASAGAGLRVAGVDVAAILMAMVLVFPAPWSATLLAFGLAVAIPFLANLVRVMVLSAMAKYREFGLQSGS